MCQGAHSTPSRGPPIGARPANLVVGRHGLRKYRCRCGSSLSRSNNLSQNGYGGWCLGGAW
eukprot:10556470-Lingulodinium_polyedra.AAC.1